MKSNLYHEPGLLLQDVQCRDYHNLPNISTCVFMNTTEDCQIDDGFVNYLVWTYCSFDPDLTWLAVILLGLWLFVLFVGLGVTADSFFCPSLQVIADHLGLSQNIAGVTFLAFGNGAPDVFSAIAAISNAKDGDAGLAFGALFGAGVFVSTVVAGTICVIKPFTSVQRPLLRDIIFFLVAGFWAFVVVWDGQILLWETLGFLLLYVVYIIVVVFGRYINQRIRYYQSGGQIVPRNDFSTKRRQHSIVGQHTASVAINAEEASNPVAAATDTDEEEVTRPLLNVHQIHRRTSIAQDETSLESSVEVINFTYWSSFTYTLMPFDVKEWKNSSFLYRISLLIQAPVFILLKLTVPLVDYDVDKHNWNKLTNTINLLLAPTFIVFAIKVADFQLFGVIPIWVVTLIFSVIIATFVFFSTELNEKPSFHWAFAYVGFFVSVVWIYTIANEIVNLLTAFGVILNISNTILGLTFLAWGNSLSDFVADVMSAKRGYPNMGISACFGGPLFNILLGVGIPFTIKCAKYGNGFPIKQSFLQDILALSCGISLCSTLIFIPLNNFKFTRKYGFYLLALYVVFLTVCILIEAGVIKSPHF